ncbi:LOW QUALITY PROTEIN: auxilin-like protein 1 [Juglans microcarpa x Juglans regia]|uniref:LOW QUALITY PROTEIN: auxilin-like protein 1 n=1 Tax=Juglans microcarpa x Juglans regia TaxID=2249226 RepID=UPI001B7EBABB|nr:LOW QUALITY PROTEIN: auxilin-like protein 1 [Juglans microcarpa x Juglans regia]
MDYQASSSTLSNKVSNAHSVGLKTVYDGAFSAPTSQFGATNLSSRVLDYGEIFTCSEASRGSSIPFLDVPAPNDSNVSVDVPSSKLDYSKVFGSFGESDFSLSFEELISEPKTRNGFSDKERNPAERGSPFEGADPSDCQERNQMYSHEASYHSFDAVEKLSKSRIKIRHGGKNGINKTTQVAQLHGAPGYTCIINEMTTLQMNESHKPVPSAVNDAYLKNDLTDGLIDSVPPTKIVTELPAYGASEQNCEVGVALQNKYGMCGSNSIDMPFGACEYGHGHFLKVSPSSSPLSNSCGSKGDSEKLMAPKFGASGILFEGTGHVSSPTYSDEDIDSNSFFVASVVALRKAIKEAQDKMAFAKESMARKKEGLQNHANLSSNYGLKTELRREGKATDKAKGYKEKKDSEMYEMEDAPEQAFAGTGEQNMMRTGRTVGFGIRKSPLGTEAALEEQFYEPVTTGKHEVMLEFKQTDSTKKEGFQKPEESSERSNAVEEAHKQEIERNVRTVEAAVKTEEHKGMKPQEWVENGKQGKDDCEEEDIQKEQEYAHWEKDTEKRLDKVHEKLVIETRFNDIHNEKENGKSLEVNGDLEGNKKLQEAGENEMLHKGVVYRIEDKDKRLKGTCKWIEAEKIQTDIDQTAVDEKRLKVAQEALSCKENNLDTADDQYKQDESKDLNENQKVSRHIENDRNVDVTFEVPAHDENGSKIEGNKDSIKLEENVKRAEGVKVEIEVRMTEESLYDEDKHETIDDGFKQDGSEKLSKNHEASRQKDNDTDVEVTSEAPAHEENGSTMEVNTSSFEHKENGEDLAAVKEENDTEDKEILETVGFTRDACRLAEIKQQMEDVIDTVGFDSERVNFVKTDMSGLQQNYQHEEEHKIAFNLAGNIEESAPELGNMTVKEVEFARCQEEDGNCTMSSHKEKCIYGNKVKADPEEDGNNSTSSHEGRWVDDGNKMKAVQLPSMFQGEGNRLETAQEIKIAQITEKNGTHQSTLTMEEKESNTTEQKDVETEEEHFKNIDEAQEREREREKIAVERAIHEARERAFAEVRERAERAAAEARQKVTAEAREKLAKTSAVNEKSPAEKAAIKARLKAERAAVERATVEARVRALERAIFKKAAFKARHQAEKYVDEKLSGASKDNGRRQSFSPHDPHHKGSSSTSNTKYPNSSSHGDVSYSPHSTERFDGTNDESAQRCIARSEMHERVAERVAKALAEKNMRDVLAQKEQAERNRLAVSLDADVKRWSSGKEWNLRALLSTLQYILGPDSGWQPIPLTDITTTSAVKKAYRKATLFVHPDKLQQRGANIEQKYICEKVFDLLKEAWNRFNVEEW